ncbi:MAG TPA: helix-turn-helix domain-containing protein [Trebonia sp.]|nr:helix-turn-helix domain-containing protein [Trebonia sp.]
MERQARAERVLDAAGELLLRVGYRRVTVDDVAERAGIGKGTVYLHWSTREELFMAVLRRELAAASDELAAGIRADPAELLLHRLTRANFLAVSSRPLLTALTLADPEVLGKLARTRHGTEHQLALDDYLQLLAGHGLVRADLAVEELAFAWHATLEGFFVAQSHAGPDSTQAALRRNADLLAATVRSAFEPSPLPDVDLAGLAPQAIGLLIKIRDAHRAQLRPAYE